jgi:hypothetical protein
VGDSHSCGTTANRSGVCWGDNTKNRLAMPAGKKWHVSQPNFPFRDPKKTLGLTHGSRQMLSASCCGGGHTCGVTTEASYHQPRCAPSAPPSLSSPPPSTSPRPHDNRVRRTAGVTTVKGRRRSQLYGTPWRNGRYHPALPIAHALILSVIHAPSPDLDEISVSSPRNGALRGSTLEFNFVATP